VGGKSNAVVTYNFWALCWLVCHSSLYIQGLAVVFISINHSRYKNGVYGMGLRLFINLPPTVTSLSHIKVYKVVHNVHYFTPLYKNLHQVKVLNCL